MHAQNLLRAISNLLRDNLIRKNYPHLYNPLQFFNKNFMSVLD